MKRINTINLILGVWLIVAPFLLAHSKSHLVATSNDIVLGFLLVAGSFWMLAERTGQFGVTAFEAACGAWLMLVPFVLHGGATPQMLINDIAVGAIVLLVNFTEAWMLAYRPRHGG
jgi:SPW repeat-containing protein